MTSFNVNLAVLYLVKLPDLFCQLLNSDCNVLDLLIDNSLESAEISHSVSDFCSIGRKTVIQLIFEHLCKHLVFAAHNHILWLIIFKGRTLHDML